MVTIELENQVEFLSSDHRKKMLKAIGRNADDHKEKIVGEVRIDTHHEAEFRLAASRPDGDGYRASLAVIVVTRRDLEVILAAMKAIEIEEERTRGI